MKLGKLKEIDIRKVWEHEQYDFSKWLAAEENIQELNDECLQKNRTAIQYIPTYLGYTLKNGSEYDLDEELKLEIYNAIN